MKLARKLTLALLVGMTAVLALHAYLQLQREAAFYERDTIADHRHYGHALATAFEKVRALEGEAAGEAFLNAVNERATKPLDRRPVQVRRLGLGDAAEAPPEVPREILADVRAGGDAHWVDRKAGRVHSYIPVSVAGAPQGALEITESLEEQTRYSGTTFLQMVATIAIIAALSGGLAFLLGAWFVGRPIEKLIGIAQRIGTGDLSRRVELRQRDEIGELAGAMNAMADHLAAALEQLRRADRLATVGKLAAGVAHELGTPLSVISGRTKMIRPGESSPEEISKHIRIMQEQLDRVMTTIRQLLDFGRPRKPEKVHVDLRALARSVLAIVGPLGEKRGVLLRMGDGDAPAVVHADAGQIQQALTNLVMNAIQAMPDGGTATVGLAEVRARPPLAPEEPERPYLRLDVRDEGEGVSPEVREHLFEPFFTTKPTGEGTGLGLSVSHGIVREHGGFLAVTSEVGRGSCFSIYLPTEDGRGGA